jgi:imidazoleglycerol-phosphate dehydratase
MKVKLERKTKETSISLELLPEGEEIRVSVSCGFLRHMVELFAFHAGMGLTVDASGDEDVDWHHLTEDLGILLGRAFALAAEQTPRTRYGWCALPMDGSLVLAAADLGGRGQFEWQGTFPAEKCGDFDLELVPEFWKAFCREGRITLHARALACDNAHHLAEALFKGAGRALREAFVPAEKVQSTKGTLA